MTVERFYICIADYCQCTGKELLYIKMLNCLCKLESLNDQYYHRYLDCNDKYTILYLKFGVEFFRNSVQQYNKCKKTYVFYKITIPNDLSFNI